MAEKKSSKKKVKVKLLVKRHIDYVLRGPGFEFELFEQTAKIWAGKDIVEIVK
jgi:hypothetical protein